MGEAHPAAGQAPPFVAAAERFASDHGRSLAFRLLGFLTRSEGEELLQTIKKIYCASIPENTYAAPESPVKTWLGAALLPFGWMLTKSIFWRQAPARDIDFEVPDAEYFNRHLKELYGLLQGTKRVAPMSGGGVPGTEASEPAQSCVRSLDCLRLILVAPVLLPALWVLSASTGVRLCRAFRQALSIYAVYGGFFARYPCRTFITIHDDSNHPCRHIAFKQSGGRDLIVIQNGDRLDHPMFAFGMMDRYLVFGRAHEELFRRIGVRSASFEPVGPIYLNARWRSLSEDPDRGRGKLFDILFIDQGVFPYEGFNERSGRSIETILRNLAAFHRTRPDLRLAYQLRAYTDTSTHRAQKAAVLAVLKDVFAGGIEVLENDGKGTSYRNVLRSNLVMTFESSLGFEALALGVKTLFVNYSGDPAETICPEERFQLVDESADFGRFERKVRELLDMRLDGVPELARERNAIVDGRFPERVAAAINAGRPS